MVDGPKIGPDGFTTLDEVDAWLVEREESAAARLGDAFEQITLKYAVKYANTMDVELAPLVAADTFGDDDPFGDLAPPSKPYINPMSPDYVPKIDVPGDDGKYILTGTPDVSAFDGADTEFKMVLDEFADQELSPTFLAGSIQAFESAPGVITPSALNEWKGVVNNNAIQYTATATNRITGASADLWADVQSKLVKNIGHGVAIPQLRKDIEAVSGFSKNRAQTIARTETIGAYNGGDWDGAMALGQFAPVEKTWLATRDARTRPTHVAANGQTVAMSDLFEVGGVSMLRPHAPGSPAGEVVNCRCIMQMLYPGDVRPDGSTVGDAAVDGSPVSEAAPPPVPAAPPEWKSEPLDLDGDAVEWTDTGHHLGGQNEKRTFKSANHPGDEFLFKPQDEWLAHGEALSSELGIRAGLNVPRVHAQQIDGRWGTVQKMTPDSRSAFGSNGQYGFDPTKVTDADLFEMQKHRMLDWMIGNHDAHGNQWIRTGAPGAKNVVQGIDKGQAFKYFGKGEKLDYKWKPPGRLGDPDTVYAAMEKAYAEGRLGTKQFWKVAKKPANNGASNTVDALQAIDADELRAMLRPYANGRFGPGEMADDFIEGVVKRQADLRLDMTRYHARLALANRKARGVHGMKGKGSALPDLPDAQGAPQGMAGALPSKFDLDWARKHDHPITDKMGHESLIDYTGGSYKEINKALRKTGYHPSSGAINRSMKPVKSAMTVHRGTRFDDLLSGSYSDLQGSVFLDRGFTSTFVDGSKRAPSVAQGNCGMEIRINVGQKGAWVDSVSQYQGEREFLLPSNSHFYVHKVRASSGKGWESRYDTIMEVEVVSESWALGSAVKVIEPGKGVVG